MTLPARMSLRSPPPEKSSIRKSPTRLIADSTVRLHFLPSAVL